MSGENKLIPSRRRGSISGVQPLVVRLDAALQGGLSSPPPGPRETQSLSLQAAPHPFIPLFVDPASSTASEADSDPREGEPVTINYKPSPLQMKIGE
ncbi:Protein FAM219A [Liparis tanakae]|uniref:Protein FAM219A n=1 Tax=Liparis tanakae TaxID=230148 RepID=A0A4Z2EDI0_9TELE|nr:Protein FAM219A [Liparis tanakae]